MTAAELVIAEMNLVKKAKEENPDMSANKYKIVVGQGINRLRIKVLAEAGYSNKEIAEITGFKESIINKELSKTA